MEIARTITDARRSVEAARKEGKRVGLVPTMGTFHEGHLSLMRRARGETGFVAVTLFVNPTQFGQGEDFGRYPRDLEGDAAMAAKEGADLLFAPPVEEMYEPDASTWVNVERLSETMCGPFRPGHFRGVATVVLKLFSIFRPDAAYFGQKDFQQARVIGRMIRDLNLEIEFVVCPTVREKDGLAMSSRNAYLAPDERARAPEIYRALKAAHEAVLGGERDAAPIVAAIRGRLEKAGMKIDYVVAAEADTLEEKAKIRGVTVIAAAAWLGKTRLIDNMLVQC